MSKNKRINPAEIADRIDSGDTALKRAYADGWNQGYQSGRCRAIEKLINTPGIRETTKKKIISLFGPTWPPEIDREFTNQDY
jgi:hypothetical protein